MLREILGKVAFQRNKRFNTKRQEKCHEFMTMIRNLVGFVRDFVWVKKKHRRFRVKALEVIIWVRRPPQSRGSASDRYVQKFDHFWGNPNLHLSQGFRRASHDYH